jgi:hypothetical protein
MGNSGKYDYNKLARESNVCYFCSKYDSIDYLSFDCPVSRSQFQMLLLSSLLGQYNVGCALGAYLCMWWQTLCTTINIHVRPTQLPLLTT